jgi:superfamily II DNA or RNA helicase
MATKYKKIKLVLQQPDLVPNPDRAVHPADVFLYPDFSDPLFNIKIAEKLEFNNTKYDGNIELDITDDTFCHSQFEIAPHQQFVRNYLSFNTPYNSMLLYHGLGSGKTCSALGICEEMRDYMKQIGIVKKIIIIASPNVQREFRTQLFDVSKLKKEPNQHWSLQTCVGTKILKEVLPIDGHLSKDELVYTINKMIDKYYQFIGYGEFANRIEAIGSTKKLKKEYENRLVVIDEVHNIRSGLSNTKLISVGLKKLVSEVSNMRLLFLSATPMYNQASEIVQLLSYMNENDGRSAIAESEVFDTHGEFIAGGKELLIQKMRGYISFVRGENPYLFPYRIYPSHFSKYSITKLSPLPNMSLTGVIHEDKAIKYIDLVVLPVGDDQLQGYRKIIEQDTKIISGGLNYDSLAKPIQALNMVYPDCGDDQVVVGSEALESCMKYDNKMFEYKDAESERFFALENIGKYSAKIKHIGEQVKDSIGIILIYSYYLDNGLIPVALMLEELGYQKHGGALLKSSSKSLGKYIIITSDPRYQSDRKLIEKVKAEDNLRGEKIKIVLISMAGSEGVDFKNIRQIHILDPWFNMSRIEQIIGRGVRTCSHKLLPFKERNVQLFMYASLLTDKPNEIALDLHVYGMAEKKAIKIGRISRILKENAVDCILNHEQTNFAQDKINTSVQIQLSAGDPITFPVGDKPYSSGCDYMSNCSFDCSPDKKDLIVNRGTYNADYMILRNEHIINYITDLYREYYILTKEKLFKLVQYHKQYSDVEILAALEEMLKNKRNMLTDRYNTVGHLINVGDFYIFQPIGLTNKKLSVFDRTRPVTYKVPKLRIKLPKRDMTVVKKDSLLIDKLYKQYQLIDSPKGKDGESAWFYYIKHVGKSGHHISVYDSLRTNLAIQEDVLNSLILDRQIDTLVLHESIEVLNYLYSIKGSLESYPKLLQSRFANRMIKTENGAEGLLLLQNNHATLYVYGKDEWREATYTEELLFKTSIQAWNTDRTTNLNDFVGYMESSTVGKSIEFKTRRASSASTKGAVCKHSPKSGIIDNIVAISGVDDMKHKLNHMGREQLCIYMELVLRYYHEIRKDHKQWFLHFKI